MDINEKLGSPVSRNTADCPASGAISDVEKLKAAGEGAAAKVERIMKSLPSVRVAEAAGTLPTATQALSAAIDASPMVQMAKSIAAAIDASQQRLRELDTQFRESVVTPFQQFQAGLRAMFAPYVAFVDALQPAAKQVQAFLDPFVEIRNRLAAIPQVDLQNFAQSISEAFRAFEQQLEKEEKLLFALFAKRGLAGMEEYLTAPEVRHILKLKKTKGVAAVDAYIFRQFRRNKYKALNAMVRGWWRVPYMNKRKTTILRAVRAHKRGEYELAIPTLLPLIDGLSAELVKGTAGLKRKTIYAIDAAALYNAREGELWSACFEQIVSSLIYKEYHFASATRPPSSINRHGILHGRVVKYASELNSYRVIFLLNVMVKITP